MRIHLVTDHFHIGGGIEHIFQIARGLKDIQFRVFGNPGEAEVKFKNLENVEICNSGYKPSTLLDGNPDCIHFHHLRPLISFFLNPFRRKSVPIIYTAHGLHIHKYEFFSSIISGLKYRLRFLLEKFFLPKTSKIIAVSHEDKQYLEEKYHLDNVQYLTNGIDVDAILSSNRTLPKKMRGELGISCDTQVFITVARFNFQKGYDILINALNQLKEFLDGHDILFLFVGDGPELPNMRRMALQYGIENNIAFLGARNDVYDLLAAADVFLLPSRWEGLPIVLLETGLLKVPVIASHTYGNREIIGNGRGVLFENRDSNALATAIMEAASGKNNLNIFSENLYREVQDNYNLKTMLTGLKQLYSSINR